MLFVYCWRIYSHFNRTILTIKCSYLVSEVNLMSRFMSCNKLCHLYLQCGDVALYYENFCKIQPILLLQLQFTLTQLYDPSKIRGIRSCVHRDKVHATIPVVINKINCGLSRRLDKILLGTTWDMFTMELISELIIYNGHRWGHITICEVLKLN